MARTAMPAPDSREVPACEVLIDSEFAAANALALAQRETEEHTRAVAKQLGYQLPADATDPDLIQRDISANMRRSVEACLEVGKGLSVLKAACGHGNFIARLDVLGIDKYVASRFIQSAAKFSKLPSNATLQAIGNQTKLFEMLVLDDEQITELEQDGQTGDLSLDDVATMSVKELRAAVRKERQDCKKAETVAQRLSDVNRELHGEVSRIKSLPANESLVILRQEATTMLSETQGMVHGRLRAALLALNDAPDAEGKSLFMAGMVGQLMADLVALRDEFNLPDVVGDGRAEWQRWAEHNAATEVAGA